MQNSLTKLTILLYRSARKLMHNHAVQVAGQGPPTHPSHKMFAAVDNVARQAGVVNAWDGHTLCLIASQQLVKINRLLFSNCI